MAEKKLPEDKNKYKVGFDVTFIAENIWTAAIAQYIALHDGTLPSEGILHTMVKSAVDGAIFFNQNKKKYGIHERLTDDLERMDV